MFTCVTIATCILAILPFILSEDLRTPPKVWYPIRPATEYYLTAQNVTINCTAEANPKPRYRWTHNGNTVPPEVTVNSETGQLTIVGYTDRESGTFQCEAYNEYTPSVQPTALSPIIEILTIGYGPDGGPDVTTPVEGKEGDYKALKCINAPVSVPPAKYSWFVESSNGNRIQVDSDNNRIFVDNEGTLHFIYLKMSDQRKDASNVYKCGMYNEKASTIKLGSPTALTVISGEANQVRPTLKHRTENALFPRTQTAELECIFSGNPIPTVTWLKDRTEIVPSSKYLLEANGMRLLIKDLEEGPQGDLGTYTCIGKNTGGESEGTIFLEVTSGPIWTEALNYLTIPIGKDARFTCKARKPFGGNFNELSEPEWYKNGEELNVLNSGKLEWSESRTVLTVRNVQKNVDVMCVQCKVTNEFGSEFDNGCLNVIDPIVVERRPADVQRIVKGDAVDLTVLGSTDPGLTLKYRWNFRNESYDNTLPPHITYDENTKAAYINTSRLTDEEMDTITGVYRRTLYHEYETVNVDMEVLIKGTTPVPILAEGSFPWWVIILLVVLLILIVIVIIIVLCCCRNKDKGDYIVYKKEVSATYLDPDQDIEDSKFHDVARIEDEGAIDDIKRPLRLGPGFDQSGDEADSLDAYEGGGRVSQA